MDKIQIHAKGSQIPAQFVRQPAQYLSVQVRVSNMGQAISSPLPALVSIKKEMGEPVAIAVLVEIIGDAIDFFNVGKTMNDKQLGETARLLLQEFYYLKIADLKLFFDRLKTGYYGQLYDRIDGNVIMLHLRNYCTERISTAEEISLLAHQQITKPATEETYIISTGAHYVAHNPTDGYFEVTQRDLATPFTLTQAIKIKHWLVTGPLSHQPETVRIKKRTAQIGLMDWMQQNTPALVPKDVAYKRKANATAARFKEIDADGVLSAYEKYCAKITLIGIVPMGEEEWERCCAKAALSAATPRSQSLAAGFTLQSLTRGGK